MLRTAASIGMALLVAGAASAAQSPSAPTANAKPSAELRGRVTDAESGRPLRHAIVRLASSNPGPARESRAAATDDSGRYAFKGLPAGRYSVSADKGGYVQLSYGQTRPFEPGKPIEVLDGQTVERVDFSLPRGGTITGRVVDEYGEPVPNLFVQVHRYQFVQGQRRLSSAGRQATTDDGGDYRIYGLPPAQYFVSARGSALTPFVSAAEDRSGYAQTFFPAAPSPAEAQRVAVGAGQSVFDVNIEVREARTARVSGIAIDSQGKPMNGGIVSIGMPSGGSAGGRLRVDGTFELSNLFPGTYSIRAQGASISTAGAAAETASATITVTDDDIDDLQLAAQPPATILGRIVLESALESTVKPAQFRIGAVALDSGSLPGGGSMSTSPHDDFTFELKTGPGRQTFRVFAMPPGYVLKAVRLDGSDITDSGVSIASNEEIRGIEIEVTTHPATVSGLVTDGRGDAARDYTAIIFGRDEQRWTMAGSRWILTARPDQDGRFRVPALPAGDYYAAAVDYVESGQWTDPEFLQALRSRATMFSVNDGESKTINLRIVQRP